MYKLLTLSTLARMFRHVLARSIRNKYCVGENAETNIGRVTCHVSRVGAEQRPRFVSPGQDQTRQQPDTDQILINTGGGHACHTCACSAAVDCDPDSSLSTAQPRSSLHFLAEQRGRPVVIVGRLQTELFMLIKLYYISQSYYTPNVNSILLIDMKIEDMRR